MKKNSCSPINPKKIFMLWPKKNSHKEFDNKFSNGPSLIGMSLGRLSVNEKE